MIQTMDAVKTLNQYRKDAVVVYTFTIIRFWDVVSQKLELDIPLTGCMGKASSIGLGIATARPDRKVWVLDGDGSLLMNLGSLITISNLEPANLVHVVFEDGLYFTTGGQPVPGAGKFDLAGIARQSGIARSFKFNELEAMEEEIPSILNLPGPTFISLKVTHGETLPAMTYGLTGVGLRRAKEELARAHKSR